MSNNEQIYTRICNKLISAAQENDLDIESILTAFFKMIDENISEFLDTY